jgi:hypothetical protein
MNLDLDQTISIETRVFALLCCVGLFCFIIQLIRRGSLKEGFAILWLLLVATISLVALFSNILFGISSLIGIFYAPTTLFLILILNILLILIHYAVVLSKQEKQIKILAQEVGRLTEQLKRVITVKKAKK